MTSRAMIVATTESARAAGAKAGALIKVGVAPIGGRGGGKDDMAQGLAATPPVSTPLCVLLTLN